MGILGEHFDLRFYNENKKIWECLDIGSGTCVYKCYEYNYVRGNRQAMHYNHAKNKIIASAAGSRDMCLSVIPTPMCQANPKECTAKSIGKGPEPMHLPSFAEVLRKVHPRKIAVFLPKWTAAPYEDEFGERSTFLNVKLVDIAADREHQGKYFVRPLNVSIVWIHHIFWYKSGTQYRGAVRHAEFEKILSTKVASSRGGGVTLERVKY